MMAGLIASRRSLLPPRYHPAPDIVVQLRLFPIAGAITLFANYTGILD